MVINNNLFGDIPNQEDLFGDIPNQQVISKPPSENLFQDIPSEQKNIFQDIPSPFDIPSTTRGVTIPITEAPIKPPRPPARPGYRKQDEPFVEMGPRYKPTIIPEKIQVRDYVEASIPFIGTWAKEYIDEVDIIGTEVISGKIGSESFDNLAFMLARDYTAGKAIAAIGGPLVQALGPRVKFILKSKVWKKVPPEVRKKIKKILLRNIDIQKITDDVITKTSNILGSRFRKPYKRIKLPAKIDEGIDQTLMVGAENEALYTTKTQIRKAYYEEVIGREKFTERFAKEARGFRATPDTIKGKAITRYADVSQETKLFNKKFGIPERSAAYEKYVARPSVESEIMEQVGFPLGATAKFKIQTKTGEQLLQQAKFVKKALKKEPSIRLFGSVTENRAIKKLTRQGIPIRKDVLIRIKDKEVTAGFRLDLQRLGNIVDDGPIGPFHDDIVKPARQIVIDRNNFETPLLQEMFDVAKQLGINVAKHTDLIRKYGEGKLTKEELKTMPQHLRVGLKQMNRWFRRFSDNLRTITNKELSALNKPLIAYRKDYYRHIPEMTMLQQKYGGLANVPDKVMRMFMKPTTPKMKASLKRQGLIPEEELQGAFEAFEDYVRLVSDTLYAAKMTSKMRGYATLTQKSSPSISAILDKKADELSHVPLFNPKTELGRNIASLAFKLQNRFVKNQIIGPLSVYVSQTLGMVQNAAIAAEKQPIIGGLKAVVDYPKQFAIEMGETIYKHLMNPAWKSFSHKYSQVYKARLATGVENLKLVEHGGSFQQFFANVLNFTDRVQVSSIFNLIYRRAFKITKDHIKAVDIADDAASRAAAEFDKVMRPYLLNTGFGRLAMPITTIPVNNMNLILEDILKKLVGTGFGWRGVKSKAVAVSMAANMYGASIVANAGTTLILGRAKFTAMDLIPFYGPVKYGMGGVLKIPATLMRIMDGQVSWFDEAYRMSFSFVPPWGGAQIYKTTEGLKAIYKGGVYTKGQDLKFPISGIAETGRAVAFGPYGTRAGGRYLQDLQDKRKK